MYTPIELITKMQAVLHSSCNNEVADLINATTEFINDAANEVARLRAALVVAQEFIGTLTAEECPDSVAIAVNEALGR